MESILSRTVNEAVNEIFSIHHHHLKSHAQNPNPSPPSQITTISNHRKSLAQYPNPSPPSQITTISNLSPRTLTHHHHLKSLAQNPSPERIPIPSFSNSKPSIMRIGFKSSFLVNAMEPSLSPPFNANATLSPPPSSGDGDETLEDAWYENIASKLLIVSLRGASAKEITRDALIERVNQERELRSYTRQANAAVMFIQRVWRRHHEMKLVALRLQWDWEIRMNEQRVAGKLEPETGIA
ncbi:E3 ubiquitin-protein ligase upl7 [Phtheirospermum japonicum]|uniref:E3 ubiquitin-protein ligase upl7 n=1 Tax=Phtheirospermum japonicum TaxID=374723 RepID=A0A830BCY1_9LAMI|nr:E3 ubiquitin-protein ligase upl7 [Phtheirospermum japonicum]